jgi:hypothetical protein
MFNQDKRRWIVNLLITMVLFILNINCQNKTSDTSDRFIDRLQPAPVEGGFRMDGYWVWGGSVIKGDDGLYHMFASRWPQNVPFSPNWVTNSEIVHAVAETPVGPYEFKEVVFERRGRDYWDGMMTHNPTIHKYGDTYLLYYIGTNYEFPLPDSAVSRKLGRKARANQRIGLATSKSPWGPWERKDEPILDVRPGHWDALITVNPAISIRPDGGVLLVYKSTAHQTDLLRLGVAFADHYASEYKRLSDEPIFDFGGDKVERRDSNSKHVEDPYIWWTDDHYEMILKDMNGNICGEKGGGIHATSEDGVNWQISEHPQAYSRFVLWDDGVKREQKAFERPQLLIQDGVPTHLYAATGEGAKYWTFDRTWNMVIPLSEP